MSVFNSHHLFRQIPAATWRSYLASRALDVPVDFDWALEEKALADALIQFFEELDPAIKAQINAELRRVHALASQRGIDALLNAHADPIATQLQFKTLTGLAERALWVLMQDATRFADAEAMLYFDTSQGKRAWKRHEIHVSEPVDRTKEAVDALRVALADKLSPKLGPGRACHIDIADRHLDGTVQVTIYLEADPDDPVEFMADGLRRRPTRPATTLAVVYHAEAGIVDTVGRGGDKVHLPLVVLFARHLLKREVTPQRVKQPLFHLNRLRYGLAFQEDCGLDLAAEGIDSLRLRNTRFKSQKAPVLEFIAFVPVDPGAPGTDSVCQTYFQERNPFMGPFNLVETTISIHFVPIGTKKPATPVHLVIHQSGRSNLRDLGEHEALAERVLRALRVTEPTQVELALAA